MSDGYGCEITCAFDILPRCAGRTTYSLCNTASSFQTICLQREVLETAIVGLSLVRGIRAPREMNNIYVNK